jgi:hypothetical protein
MIMTIVTMVRMGSHPHRQDARKMSLLRMTRRKENHHRRQAVILAKPTMTEATVEEDEGAGAAAATIMTPMIMVMITIVMVAMVTIVMSNLSMHHRRSGVVCHDVVNLMDMKHSWNCHYIQYVNQNSKVPQRSKHHPTRFRHHHKQHLQNQQLRLNRLLRVQTQPKEGQRTLNRMQLNPRRQYHHRKRVPTMIIRAVITVRAARATTIVTLVVMIQQRRRQPVHQHDLVPNHKTLTIKMMINQPVIVVMIPMSTVITVHQHHRK